MLSVRLPDDLETQLNVICAKQNLNKSKIVQIALRKHLNDIANDPFLAWIGQGKAGMTTDELMRMTRGEDWNQA